MFSCLVERDYRFGRTFDPAGRGSSSRERERETVGIC